MPNWCSTAYVIEGNAKEVEKLYKLMKGLQERKEPSVENGFGTTWLGCLVDALGGNWKKINCRGDWNSLERVGDTLRFTTETAWAPCTETFDWVCKKFPSIRCFYRTEEPGMAIYETNDNEGKYFPEKYRVELSTPQNEFMLEYFVELSTVFEWLGKVFGQPVETEEQVSERVDQWQKEEQHAHCCIDKFKIVNDGNTNVLYPAVKTYEYQFGEEKIVVTEDEVRLFYPEEYRLTEQDIEQFAGYHTAERKYYRMDDCRLTPELVRRLLDEEHLMKAGESDSFTIQLYFLWHVRIRKEPANLAPFKYALNACCLDNIQSFSRRYTTLEKALLHCLNGFNENAAVRDRYQSLQEYFHKHTHDMR